MLYQVRRLAARLIFTLFLFSAPSTVRADANDILCDSGLQPTDRIRNPFSPSRCQMAFRFFAIMTSYLLIWFVTGARDTLPTSTLGLTGINAGTALGAIIDVSLSQQPYTKISKLQCDSVKIQIFTECVDDSYPPFPECVRQEITFTPASTGQATTKSTTAKRVPVTDVQNRSIGQYLDSLVNAWACVKDASQTFLTLRYGTGGNCDTCEWIELYDLGGNLRATSKGGSRGDPYNQLKRTYEKLQLPKPWPLSAFIEVPLRRERD